MVLMKKYIILTQEIIKKFSEMVSRLGKKEVRQIMTIITF